MYATLEFLQMHQTNLHSMLQESLKRLDVILFCPELASGIKLPLDSMEVVAHVEGMLEDETNFVVLVSFHLLKLTLTEMCNHDHI